MNVWQRIPAAPCKVLQKVVKVPQVEPAGLVCAVRQLCVGITAGLDASAGMAVGVAKDVSSQKGTGQLMQVLL